MRLKQISFIMENCEVITIDGKYVGDFRCRNLEKSIERVACNSILEMNIIKDFSIEISKNANISAYKPFGMDRGDYDATSIFDRFVKYFDITSIEFDLCDDTKNEIMHYEYYVDWCGDSEYTNTAQRSYISELGNLYIVICQSIEENPEKLFEDYFDKNVINDEESMSFRFNMLNVPYGIETKEEIKEREEMENMNTGKKITVVPENELEDLRNRILSCDTIYDIDDVLTEQGLISAEGKTGFLRGLFKLSAPDGQGDYGKYETILKFLLNKE